jgi:hypothetical protein
LPYPGFPSASSHVQRFVHYTGLDIISTDSYYKENVPRTFKIPSSSHFKIYNSLLLTTVIPLITEGQHFECSQHKEMINV